jgi:hypothetical protein
MVPQRHRRQAQILLQQFDKRGNELTWNSDGIIYVDQTSLPQSNIFLLFPYLFKMKHPKNLPAFEDFRKKIYDMGLDHLIVKKYKAKAQSNQMSDSKKQSVNWWFLD